MSDAPANANELEAITTTIQHYIDLFVVFTKPRFRALAGFAQRFEPPSIQAAIPEYAVETLVVSVLFGTMWRRPNLGGIQRERGSRSHFSLSFACHLTSISQKSPQSRHKGA